MHLTDIPSLEDGKGNGAAPSKPAYDKQQTLSLAAKLLNSDKERLKKILCKIFAVALLC
ncbi:hypothetical protein MUB16_24930 [Priestia sp. OVL9]|nr:hypothetical protein [Priestia sp. OVL9]